MLDGQNCNITIKKIKFYTQKRQNSDCFMLLQISCSVANNVACCIIFRMLYEEKPKTVLQWNLDPEPSKTKQMKRLFICRGL